MYRLPAPTDVVEVPSPDRAAAEQLKAQMLACIENRDIRGLHDLYEAHMPDNPDNQTPAHLDAVAKRAWYEIQAEREAFAGVCDERKTNNAERARFLRTNVRFTQKDKLNEDHYAAQHDRETRRAAEKAEKKQEENARLQRENDLRQQQRQEAEEREEAQRQQARAEQKTREEAIAREARDEAEAKARQAAADAEQAKADNDAKAKEVDNLRTRLNNEKSQHGVTVKQLKALQKKCREQEKLIEECARRGSDADTLVHPIVGMRAVVDWVEGDYTTKLFELTAMFYPFSDENGVVTELANPTLPTPAEMVRVLPNLYKTLFRIMRNAKEKPAEMEAEFQLSLQSMATDEEKAKAEKEFTARCKAVPERARMAMMRAISLAYNKKKDGLENYNLVVKETKTRSGKRNHLSMMMQ